VLQRHVWFTSREATGARVAADGIRQDKINEIPPSSPIYDTTDPADRMA
jgi:hypothetical protein